MVIVMLRKQKQTRCLLFVWKLGQNRGRAKREMIVLEMLGRKRQSGDGVMLDLPPDHLMDVTDHDVDESDLPPDFPVDPASGDPIHPWQPPWLKPGQAVTYYKNGQRQLGHLNLSDSFQWCFTHST